MSVAVKIETANQSVAKMPLQGGSKQLQFSAKTLAKIKRIIKRYPLGKQQSAVIPALKLAQDEFDGWLSTEAMNLVADTLEMPYIRVYEVATFYTMFNLQPIGKYHVQVCTNCSCMIRGSNEILQAVKAETGLKNGGEITVDGLFTFHEVECLGACVEAPMMQINNHYYTKLTPQSAQDILKKLRAGKKVENATPVTAMKDGY